MKPVLNGDGGVMAKSKYCRIFKISFLYMVICTTVGWGGQPLVFDHFSANPGIIPDYWIEKVKRDQMLIHCSGLSHSYQYENGLLLLQLNDPRFAVQIGDKLSGLNAEDCLHVLRSNMDDYNYWSSEGGRQAVLDLAQQAITEGRPCAASLWCWCWDICNPQTFFSQADDFTEEHINLYLSAIDQFNQNAFVSPTVFIYHTSVSDCKDYLNPDGPWRVTYFNDYIRDFVAQNGGILMDQADIENWNISNTEQRIELDDQARQVLLRHTDYDESNGPDTMSGDHANDALCLRKASALWHLAARLAGWDGCMAVQGDLTGDCVVDLKDIGVLANIWLTTSNSPNWRKYADIAPAGGDGIINAADFAVIGDLWQSNTCEIEYAADFNHNCKVEIEDLALFSRAWLSQQGEQNWNEQCDLEIENSQGIINLSDFAVFSTQWAD